MRLRALLPLALCPVVLGCPDGGGDDAASDGSSGAADASGSADGVDSTGEDPGFDEAMVIEMAGMYAADLVKINDQPFMSEHALADMVNVYINAEAADMFRTLDPEAPVEVAMPEGTLIVKEHRNAEGAADGYLMMYRGPDDYAAETSNWFWARVDGAGVTQNSGQVGFCIDCHARAPSLVFGVSPDNQL